MSKSYSSLREDLIRTSNDKEYRHAYAEESLNVSVATQIKVLREQRNMTQQHLAEEAGMKQSMISRYENVNYSSWNISTLRKLAKAFDVDLEVRFRSFREMVESVDNFSRETLQVPKFTEDPYFQAVQPAAEGQPSGIAIALRAGTAYAVRSDITFSAQQSVKPDVRSAASEAIGPPVREVMTGWQQA
jgi:transcriptional regulator with XRE-family HTH domain